MYRYLVLFSKQFMTTACKAPFVWIFTVWSRYGSIVERTANETICQFNINVCEGIVFDNILAWVWNMNPNPLIFFFFRFIFTATCVCDTWWWKVLPQKAHSLKNGVISTLMPSTSLVLLCSFQFNPFGKARNHNYLMYLLLETLHDLQIQRHNSHL